MMDDLRNMVWRGHYLGYGPAHVMLHVPVDRNFIQGNRQSLIFAPYYRETVVFVHNKKQLAQINTVDDLQGLPLGVERGQPPQARCWAPKEGNCGQGEYSQLTRRSDGRLVCRQSGRGPGHQGAN